MKKNRKKIIFIIILFAVALMVTLFLSLSQNSREEIVDRAQNIFPFGEIQSSGTQTNPNNQQDTIQTEQNTEDNTPERDLPLQPKLRQVSTFPTGGFIPITRVEDQIILENIVNEEGAVSQSERVVELENQYIRYSKIDDSSIYETKVSPYSLKQENLVDTTIPNTEHVVFSDSGDYVALQYWDDSLGVIQTYLGHIEKIQLDIDPCPFTIQKKIELGSEGSHVSDLHKFLNRNPRTLVARSGVNSPGNEGSKAVDGTIIAIKNFQSLNELDIDGVTGPATRAKMQQVCLEQQRIIAEDIFANQEEKFTISGRFLADDIISIDMKPGENIAFYLQKQIAGVVGVRRNLIDGKQETIFNSPLQELRTTWNDPTQIEISTKPSYLAQTYTYTMDSSSGEYQKSLREDFGMITLPNGNNTKTFISKNIDGTPTSMIYDFTTQQETVLDFVTFADKCVWSKNNIDVYCGVPSSLLYAGEYPDKWYQGMELYTDIIYKVNTETGEQTEVTNLFIEHSESIDVSEIHVDEKDEYLYFLDKGTEHLWSYRLFDI